MDFGFFLFNTHIKRVQSYEIILVFSTSRAYILYIFIIFALAKTIQSMANPYFDFKQFRVRHDRCAQKVGTDGVLLGAWAKVPQGDEMRILDIGTGSGLIALMMAQRYAHAQVVALDIEPESLEQARENIEESPFKERMSTELCDIRNYEGVPLFDVIVCNPPFYTTDTLPPSPERALARNAALLPFSDLAQAVSRLLSEEGCFSVVLPCDAKQDFVTQCLIHGLQLSHLCWVKTVERKPAKRCLMTFNRKTKKGAPLMESTLVLQDGASRSEAYQLLMQDFYLS